MHALGIHDAFQRSATSSTSKGSTFIDQDVYCNYLTCFGVYGLAHRSANIGPSLFRYVEYFMVDTLGAA